MPVWFENWKRGTVSAGTDWTVLGGGFHIESYPAIRNGGLQMNWLAADNPVVVNNTISMATPACVQNMGISCKWDMLWKFNVSGSTAVRYFSMLALNSTFLSDMYYVQFTVASNLIRFLRYNGAVETNVGTSALIYDDNEHALSVTREVSGANRFWRVYVDGNLLIGPVNDTTYTTARYIQLYLRYRGDMVTNLVFSS